MQAFAAGRLAKADETQIIEAVAHFARRLDDRGERHVRPRIEIEDKTAGNLRLPRLAIPGMKLDGADFDADGNLYFSAYAEGKIYRTGADGNVTVFREGLVTPADINIDRTKRLLLIPSFDGNAAYAVPL